MNSYPQKIHIDRPKNVSHGRSHVSRLMGLSVLLACMAVLTWAAQAAVFKADSSSLQSESCPNGYFDPGETNTVQFVIKNNSGASDTAGGGDLTDVQVELLSDLDTYPDPANSTVMDTVSGSNVLFVFTGVSAKQSLAHGATMPITISFKDGGLAGRFEASNANVVSPVRPVLRITFKDNAGNQRSEILTFGKDQLPKGGQLGQTVESAYTFSSTSSITLNDYDPAGDKQGRANPYPSSITAAGIPNDLSTATGERVVDVAVTLNGVNHTVDQQVQALLVSPTGQKVVLFRNAGNSTSWQNLTFTISGRGSSAAPLNAPFVNGSTYKPGDYSQFTTAAKDFPDVASPYGSSIDSFKDKDPNGQWKLYLMDNSFGGSGSVTGGWTLKITTAKVVSCTAGANPPYVYEIKTLDDGSARLTAGIANKEINENTVFTNSDNAKESWQYFSPSFTVFVSDLESGTDGLALSAISADETLIKGSNVKFSGSGGNRTMQFQPEANQSGSTQISVVATDSDGHSSVSTFTLKVNFKNRLPIVSAIGNQAANIGTPINGIPFTISDIETPVDQLVVTAHAYDPTPGVPAGTPSPAVPDSNIFFTREGNNMTVSISPADSSVGSPGSTLARSKANIVIYVDDADGGETQVPFTVDFSTASGLPTISPINSLTKEAGNGPKENTTFTVDFTVRSGSVTPVDNLAIGVNSSNPLLIPVGNISLSGTGSSRHAVIAPIANVSSESVNPANGQKIGTTTITFTVSDGPTKQSQSSFSVYVQPVNQKPTISTIPSQYISENGATAQLPFTVSDIETAAASLTISYNSSRPDVVPNGAIIANMTGSEVGVHVVPTPNDGTGQGRLIKIVPAAHAFGLVTIDLTVTDDGKYSDKPESRTMSFTVNVNPINDPPTVTQAGTALLNNDKGEQVLDADGNPPVAVEIAEDTNVNSDGSASFNTLSISGIYPGLPPSQGPLNESEQTVTLAATVDRPDIISTAVFDVDPKNKIKYSTTATTLRYKLAQHEYGDVVVTLTATDNGTGALGNDSKTTTRKFIISVKPTNYKPTMDGIANQEIAWGGAIVIPITTHDTAGTAQADMHMEVIESSNQSVVNTNNIIFGIGNTFVTIKAEPMPGTDTNVTATTRITLKAKDRGPYNDDTPPLLESDPVSFNVTAKYQAPNHAPVVSDITMTSTTIQENGVAVGTVTVYDQDPNETGGDTANLRLSGTSSDTKIVPNGNILFGGVGNVRTMAVAGGENAFGSVTISVVAIDPQGFSSPVKKVDLTIIHVEQSPTISVAKSDASGTAWKSGGVIQTTEGVSPIPDPKTGSGWIEATVHDPEDDDAGKDLEVKAIHSYVRGTTDNSPLIPIGNIEISSSGAVRTVKISPVEHLSGEADITLQVKDSAGNITTTSFGVRVLEINDPPTIDQVAAMSLPKNSVIQTLVLTGITAGPKEGGQTVSLSVQAYNRGSNPDDNKNDYIRSDNLSISPTSITTPTDNSDSTATLTFQTVANKTGSATIRVKLTDNGANQSGDNHNTTYMSFDVTIGDFNNPPTIDIPPQYQSIQVNPGQASQIIPITINDPGETAASALVLTFVSDNQAVIPNSNLTQTGSAGNRGLIITPLMDTFGLANITATVTDAGLPSAPGTDVKSASKVIKVTVAPGSNPIISQVSTNGVVTTNVTTRVGVDSDIISFTVNDAQTPAASLVVTATSDNPTLVPDGNIQFGGGGSTRMMIIRPAANQAGIANVVLRVRDLDGFTGTNAFTFTVLGAPPTITSIADQQIDVGGATPTLNFQVSSATTFAGFLVVSATSDTQRVVPDGNIFLGGSGTSRTVKVVGAASQYGTALITVSVQDSQRQVTSTTFKVSTPPQVENQPPTISKIDNQNVVVSNTLPIISFTVGDDLTPVADLKVTATSSNTRLVPASNIFLGGSGATRTMLLTLAPGQVGTSLIIVTVTDGGGKSTTTSFTVTVSAVVKSVPNDFNGDGIPDLIFEDASGSLAYWFMSGDAMVSSGYLTPSSVGDAGWRVVASADFNADGKTDLLFQHTDGSLAVWLMDGVTYSSGLFVNPASSGKDWQAVAVGDFNGDGKPDILFQATDGSLALWYMDGIKMTSVAMLNPAAPSDKAWRVAGVGDVNGDGKTDVLFQHTDGTLAVWYMNNNNLLLGAFLNPANPGDANWRVVGVTDQNGDKKPDLLFQNKADGSLSIWYMNGAKLMLGKLLNPSNATGSWQIVAP